MKKQGCAVFVALSGLMVGSVCGQGGVKIIDRDWEEDFEIRNPDGTGKYSFVQVRPQGDLLRETKIYDSCVLALQGGEIRSVYMYNNSSLYLDEGHIKGWVYLYDNSYCSFTGGGFHKYFRLYGFSKMELFGGETSYDDDESVKAYDNSQIVVYGRHFEIGGEHAPSGGYTAKRVLEYPSPVLTCILQDGHEFELYLCLANESRLILVEVPTCLSRPVMDINEDCKVDMSDFAIFASEWMTCNLEPQEECWE